MAATGTDSYSRLLFHVGAYPTDTGVQEYHTNQGCAKAPQSARNAQRWAEAAGEMEGVFAQLWLETRAPKNVYFESEGTSKRVMMQQGSRAHGASDACRERDP